MRARELAGQHARQRLHERPTIAGQHVGQHTRLSHRAELAEGDRVHHALSQAAANLAMIPARYGRIVNVASVAGLAGTHADFMRTIAYNSAKGAVVNFTRALAGEWGPHGITVNALAPGFFPSKMSQGLIEKLGEKSLIGAAPLQRLGDDEDLKGAALLFASDAGKHITGQILAVDGGYTAV